MQRRFHLMLPLVVLFARLTIVTADFLDRRATAEVLLPKPAVTVARSLFSGKEGTPVASLSNQLSCGKPGEGSAQPAAGPGGCLNAAPGIAGFEGAEPQTPISFLVESCGIVAPHTHANAVEVNTVVKGRGIIAQLTVNSNKLQVSEVVEGDSFFFEQGSYHWWMNLGDEQLVTVGAFLNTADPDAALVAYDDGAGIVGELMKDQDLLHTLVGQSNGKKNIVPFEGGSPLFPKLTPADCEYAKKTQLAQAMRMGLQTANAFQKNPFGTNLFEPSELQTGKFDISDKNTPVHGPGGGLRPLGGEVMADKTEGVSATDYDGSMKPTQSGGGPPPPALWPGFTNVGGGKTLVKFVVGYCGTVAIHTHTNAAEWNTVISGSGQVSYYQVNTGAKPQVITMDVNEGDTFVFPKGALHWWVNRSPTKQLATIGGFTAPFPDTSLLTEMLSQTNQLFPVVTSAVLGEGFVPSAAAAKGNLFPLLDSRQPASCGGDVPCTSC